MNDDKFAELLDTLYYELVNEIGNCEGFLDASSVILADAIKDAVRSTRIKLYGDPDSEN